MFKIDEQNKSIYCISIEICIQIKLIKYCIKYKNEELRNYFHKKYIVRYNVPCMYYKVKY